MPRGRRSGQALVEFALALPLVLLLIFGVLEFGRAFQIKIVLENAAREGVHYLIYDRDDPGDGFPNTIAAVMAESQNSGVEIVSTDVTVQCLDAVGDPITTSPLCPTGSTAEVIVTHPFNVALFGYFLGEISLASNARMYMP
ncbi:MAG: pilus assembly protein [Anaerolineales bacterium]|nr:pilus assembly protein [Anaerolineales bacterium]